MEWDFSLIGHSRQREQLLHDIASGNVAHAYLLSGRRHLGKFTVAKWFARELLTHNKNEEERKNATHLMRKNMHPDLLTIDQLWIDGVCTDWDILARSSNVSQEKRAKNRAKTNTIGIDEVRELQRRLHETSQTGMTCCLIRSLERLHVEAANALLKILEEPPQRVVFCCTTEAPSMIPSTILSRMRIVQFSPLPAGEIRPLLASFAEEDRLLLGSIAQGAPGIILRCQENPETLRAFRQAHMDTLRFLTSRSCLERLQQVTAVLEHDEDRRQFFRHLLLHLRERLRASDTEASAALPLLRLLFATLHALASNAQKPLLAAELALRSSSLSHTLPTTQ